MGGSEGRVRVGGREERPMDERKDGGWERGRE